MGDKRATLILLLILSVSLLIDRTNLVFAKSDNWSEVTTISGKGSITTSAPFTCNNAEWRIRWEVEPQSGFLAAYIYPDESHAAWFESIIKVPENNETNGTLYIQDNNGSFYLDILATAETTYTLIVEQNMESIPEFPSWTPLLIMVVAVLSVAVVYRRSLSGTIERRGENG